MNRTIGNVMAEGFGDIGKVSTKAICHYLIVIKEHLYVNESIAYVNITHLLLKSNSVM